MQAVRPDRQSRPNQSLSRIGPLVAALLVSPVLAAGPALHDLARHPDSAPLEAALSAGADPDQPVDSGATPLMTAVEARRAAAVATLLAAGADPDNTNRLGESALHLAAAGKPRILRLLLEAGANPNVRDAGGVTPVMLAAAAGRADNIALLREAGARIDMKDYQGAAPRDWAARNNHAALAQAMDEAAAAAEPAPAKPTGLDFAEDVFVDVRFPPWFKTSFLDLGEDLDEALAAGKQGILLFVSASRCSYCKAFMDTSLGDAEIRGRLRAGFDVIGLDIFDDRELTTLDGEQVRVKEYVTQVRASYTPTLLFVGEGGRPLLRIVGYYPPERFRQVLDYLEAREYQHRSLREYLQMLSRPAGGAARPMIADALFQAPPYMLDRRAMPAERPLLVVFERPGCEACERFHQRVLQDKAIRRLVGRYEAVQLDASDGEGRVVTPNGERTSPAAWYRKLGLSYHPALVFFDEGGTEVMRLDSETLRFRMEGTLQLVLERAYEEDAQLQRWRRAKAIESIQRRRDPGATDS